MREFVLSGAIAYVVIAVMVVEAVVLLAYRKRTGRGIPHGALVANLMAGAGIILALQAALLGWAWPWIMAFLTLSFAAHLADLRNRWHAG